jgi:hypothetical protein
MPRLSQCAAILKKGGASASRRSYLRKPLAAPVAARDVWLARRHTVRTRPASACRSTARKAHQRASCAPGAVMLKGRGQSKAQGYAPAHVATGLRSSQRGLFRFRRTHLCISPVPDNLVPSPERQSDGVCGTGWRRRNSGKCGQGGSRSRSSGRRSPTSGGRRLQGDAGQRVLTRRTMPFQCQPVLEPC